ncbi:MAG: hypothetical protein H3C29_03655 [Simplicispira suum]|uniref:hypothetical protein n=1 Tax=Simplicispira suum TaxID=2109915 RepID=UPI001C6D0B9A|nr:hypothetical protein [Simplicispira suum]MBW7832288.1 hypothetical protein [Simplicispira suum]
MDFLSALNHLLNFLAPALAVPLLLWLPARLALGRPAGAPRWWLQWLAQAGVGTCVLLGGLVLLGRDGKMLTYAALVLACASCQWLLQRGWRR